MKQTFHLIALLSLIAIALFLGTPALLAQGWQDLPNTKLQSVCPPDNFQPTSGGMPPYSFHGLCYGKITDYSSATVDTKRNRLLMWGGGHGGYQGNEVYSLDMVTKSTSVATCGGFSCITSTNSSAPTMTRLNDPSVYTLATCATETSNADGTPITAHTWGTWIYLPKHDKVFQWLGYTACGGSTPTGPDRQIWLWDAATQTWANMGARSSGSSSSGAFCALDPTTAHETLLCFLGNKDLVRYDVDTNSVTELIPYGTDVIQTGPTVVVDPDRKILFAIGTSYIGPSSPDPHIYAIELTSGNYVETDWTSSVTGCGDLMGYAYPSVVWDPTIHKIVGYVPRTLSSTSANNRVIIFDPATKTCVAQPLSGGPAANGALLNTTNNTEQGMFGHFNYFPALGKYVVVNNEAADAYTFTLNVTPTNGLGNSTVTCVDRDGDGYGTGPGCAGPDADDLDATVHTSPQFLAKWSTIPAGLQHLGYNPANVWYISTTGNDGTGVVNDITHPFATCCGPGKVNPAPGDAVVLRGGTYTFFAVFAPSGTAGNPIIYMSYPGELAYFTPYPAGFNIIGDSYVVMDGLKFYASGGTACVNLGIISYTVIRHVEASGCEWGIDSELPLDLTIEDSVLHDAPTGSGGQHGIYLTNHSLTTTAHDVFVRRNLLYNNPYTGFQFNGKVNNLIVEQNISYNNDTAGFSWLSGVSKSFFRSNVSINNAQGLVLYQYQAFCDVYDPTTNCPYGENNNMIENFTNYSTGIDRFGVPYGAGFAAITVADDSTNKHDMGHNTYRNINVVNYHVNGFGLAPINASDAALAYFSTSTFDHLNAYNASTPAGTAAFTVGTTYYTCAQAAAAATVFGSVINCNFGDPQFVAASTSYYNTPGLFDLRLQSSSPAIHAGTPVWPPTYDLLGNSFGNPPSLGAFESASTTTTQLSCDLNHDGTVNILDVQLGIGQALGLSACGTADLTQDGQCNVVDVQRIIASALGNPCVIGN